MQDPVLKPQKPVATRMLTVDKALGIVWESAVESAVTAFLVMVFGSVAIGITSGIWRVMTPSRPPGMVLQPETEARPSLNWTSLLLGHRLILFGLIFIPTLSIRLARCDTEAESEKNTGLRRIGHDLAKQWFGLVVGNAFGAMIAAILITAFARFTPVRMLFGWLINAGLVELQRLLGWLFGSSTGGTFQAWLNWYGDNQLKVTFWFLYVAAIYDDLGIPNYKALGRWLKGRYWRRAPHNDQPSR